MGTGLAAATGVAFAVGYGMYADASCFTDSSYKSVDCFVDAEFGRLVRNISIVAAPAFVLFFPLGYWAARDDTVSKETLDAAAKRAPPR